MRQMSGRLLKGNTVGLATRVPPGNLRIPAVDRLAASRFVLLPANTDPRPIGGLLS
jgi:hypothetical protein